MLNLLKNQLADWLLQNVGSEAGIERNDIIKSLEIPKNYDHGHLAFPVFSLAKQLKLAPPVIAKNLSEKLLQKKLPIIEKIEPVSGFINFSFSAQALQSVLFSAYKENPSALGVSHEGRGKTVVIDFSSPNVAKPMHVGHLRATVIGQALRNLAAAQGYRVIGVNHIGDWGTQFGKLAWAMEKWSSEYQWGDNPIEVLLKMYVRFHEEAEKNPDLEKAGAEYFKRLEDGDPAIQKIWKQIIEYSLKEYDKIYSLLNVKHDAVLGESFYNDKMAEVIQRLESAKLLQESEGAQVVFFDEKENMPPCLIKKSDGASIYATRDLAAAIYRREVQGADQLLYVVGQDQTLHFKQVFRVLEMMGYDWAKSCHHLPFGLYRFKEGKMSTRQGRVILAEDILLNAIEIVKAMIAEKNPLLENKDKIAEQVAVGAVLFNDLINDRAKNVEFDWDRMTSMEGDSGPYVQYSLVRCRSILRKLPENWNLESSYVLSAAEEKKIMLCLLQFQDVVSASYRLFKPNILAQYLLELCAQFSHFYHHCRILGEPEEVLRARARLVAVTEAVLEQGLSLLGIPSPQAM